MKISTYNGAKRFLIIGSLAIALMIALACAGDEDTPEPAAPAPDTPEPAAPAPTTAPAAPAQQATSAPAQPAPAMQTTKSDMDSGLTDESLTLLVANVGATGGWDPTPLGRR